MEIPATIRASLDAALHALGCAPALFAHPELEQEEDEESMEGYPAAIEHADASPTRATGPDAPPRAGSRIPASPLDQLVLAEAVTRKEGQKAIGELALGIDSGEKGAADALEACTRLLTRPSASLDGRTTREALRNARERMVALESRLPSARGRFEGLTQRLAALLLEKATAASPRGSVARGRKVQGPQPGISSELLREAAAYAAEHGRPLLTRLVEAMDDEHVIEAYPVGVAGNYALRTRDERTGLVPRILRLESWWGASIMPEFVLDEAEPPCGSRVVRCRLRRGS